MIEQISKTSKKSYDIIYLTGKKLEESNFLPGVMYSYEIDFENKKIKIVPNNEYDKQGKVSKKNIGDKITPIIDINNSTVRELFKNTNECRICYCDNEILIESTENDEKKIIKVNKSDIVPLLNLVKEEYTYSEDDITQAVLNDDIFKQYKDGIEDTLKVLSLFSGIGAFEEALKNLNIKHEVVNYCEIEEYIAKSYSEIHDIDYSLNLGDIKKVDEYNLKDFDLMTCGFPCQDIVRP